MKFNKYFIHVINTDETFVLCSPEMILKLMLDSRNWPMRVVPLDSNGDLIHSEGFLVGDDYSLSFMFNNKDF